MNFQYFSFPTIGGPPPGGRAVRAEGAPFSFLRLPASFYFFLLVGPLAAWFRAHSSLRLFFIAG
jgi:hypothetical protein